MVHGARSALRTAKSKEDRLSQWAARLYDQRVTTPVKTEIPLMDQYELKLMHEHLRNTCKFHDVIIWFIPAIKKNCVKAISH